MIWGNAWAWLGLLALALPVLIHLLSRRRARVQPFPSLRFLQTSRLQPTRSTRINDRWLLALRVAILAAAVAALAQPVFVTAQRRRNLQRTLARVVIVDTSASMQRTSTTGERALAAARRDAQTLANTAATSVILETAAIADALAGAHAWLDTQPGLREVVVVSDFQLGALEESDLTRIAPDIGVQLQQVAIAPATAPLEMTTRNADGTTVAHIALTAQGTEVEWTVRADTGPSGAVWLNLAGAAEQAAARAAEQAAWSVSGKPLRSDRSVTFVHPHYEQRAQLLRAAQPLDQPWMAEAVTALQRDSLLSAVAQSAGSASDPGRADSLIVLARNETGQAVALAARGQVNGRAALLLFSQSEAGSLMSAALMAAAARALAVPVQASELEPATTPVDALQRWQRTAQPMVRPALERDTNVSDGRWFWLLALLLLGIESWVRRSRQPAQAARAAEVPNERVA